MNQVEICNLALSRVRAKKIASLSDSTKEARDCTTFYTSALESTLEAHNWGFARKYLTLALLDETYSGWSYAYQYPSDCIVVRKIYNGSEVASSSHYDAEWDNVLQISDVPFEIGTNAAKDSKTILTSKEDAEAIYTANITNPTIYPPLFTTAFSFRLAADLALSVRSDEKLSREMFSFFLNSIGESKAVSSNQAHKKPDTNNVYAESR